MNLNTDFPIEVFRTKRRKTASIKIMEGQVHVVVPKRLSDAKVKDLILKRTSWIKQKLSIHSETILPKPKEYVNGENFTYLGRNYRLKLIPNGEKGVKLKGANLELGVSKTLSESEKDSFVKSSIVQWYKIHAFERLTEKSERYGRILGVNPKSIILKHYKSRWGSCSYSGKISYNWCIIIAPYRIVDYVVVHELCHILEHNHSPEYWRNVKNIIPEYKKHRKWLKENGVGLFV